ncbi:MAG: T9SS type B sorting domain-containing protein [Ferruginibacter sp.]|nr:T9SS type B sorting domain-containing protein [Ferruginibacter sp.]
MSSLRIFFFKRCLHFFLYLILTLFVLQGKAQECTELGQNPSTAFPVCGSSVFVQNSVPICGNRAIISACNTGVTYLDKNPYWYKFRCYTPGTLGFVITPLDLNDDYDWQLFDITNRNPENIYTDISMFVACNWSGETGRTGASSAGVTLVNCDGGGVPIFSSMPILIQDHEYLLLVSHFTNSQSGYSLSFEGGTAGIIDPKEPHLTNAYSYCSGNTITVALNKKMKCNSLDANGTEFKIDPPLARITKAIGKDCNAGFDSDTILITLDKNLPPGNYKLSIGKGTDGNTLLDNCDRSIPLGDEISWTVNSTDAPALTVIRKDNCSPKMLELQLSKSILCSSLDFNGSEFTITGNYPVNIGNITTNCSGGLASIIKIELSRPLQKKSNFELIIQKGTDGNTLLDDCGQEIPAGSKLSFSVADTVNADFQFTLSEGCKEDVVNYTHNGNNEVNIWKWNFNDQPSSNLQNPSIQYQTTGIKQTELIVSNGNCSDTVKKNIYERKLLKAKFGTTNVVCPGDNTVFTDQSEGENIINWFWDFGNGQTSFSKTPPEQVYTISTSDYSVPVKLIITNNKGCKDTATVNLSVIANCYIAVPSAFTPNNDGLNDYLYPLNAYRAKNLRFSVYNRFGQRVFYTEDWTKKWNGKIKGEPADAGAYVWLLHYIDDKNKTIDIKGTSILIR